MSKNRNSGLVIPRNNSLLTVSLLCKSRSRIYNAFSAFSPATKCPTPQNYDTAASRVRHFFQGETERQKYYPWPPHR